MSVCDIYGRCLQSQGFVTEAVTLCLATSSRQRSVRVVFFFCCCCFNFKKEGKKKSEVWERLFIAAITRKQEQEPAVSWTLQNINM